MDNVDPYFTLFTVLFIGAIAVGFVWNLIVMPLTKNRFNEDRTILIGSCLIVFPLLVFLVAMLADAATSEVRGWLNTKGAIVEGFSLYVQDERTYYTESYRKVEDDLRARMQLPIPHLPTFEDMLRKNNIDVDALRAKEEGIALPPSWRYLDFYRWEWRCQYVASQRQEAWMKKPPPEEIAREQKQEQDRIAFLKLGPAAQRKQYEDDATFDEMTARMEGEPFPRKESFDEYAKRQATPVVQMYNMEVVAKLKRYQCFKVNMPFPPGQGWGIF